MSMIDAERLIRTLDPGWSFDISEVDHSDDDDRKNHKLPAGLGLIREFVHPDFLAGAAFTSKIAAVSAMNDHYPSLQLHRRIVRKNWEVVTQVRCHTLVLGGLSMHDFHLAMVRAFVKVKNGESNNHISACKRFNLLVHVLLLVFGYYKMIDVEVGRAEVQKLLLRTKEDNCS